MKVPTYTALPRHALAGGVSVPASGTLRLFGVADCAREVLLHIVDGYLYLGVDAAPAAGQGLAVDGTGGRRPYVTILLPPGSELWALNATAAAAEVTYWALSE